MFRLFNTVRIANYNINLSHSMTDFTSDYASTANTTPEHVKECQSPVNLKLKHFAQSVPTTSFFYKVSTQLRNTSDCSDSECASDSDGESQENQDCQQT